MRRRIALWLLRPDMARAQAALAELTRLVPQDPDIVEWPVEWDACLRCGAANHLTGYHVTALRAGATS